MTDYQPVPFPFEDPSNPDVAVETPLWKGGPRPQWEVSGEPVDPRTLAGDITLSGKTYHFPAVDPTLTKAGLLDQVNKAMDSLMIPRIGGYVDPISKMNVNDIRHPISLSCVCPTPISCATENWCRLSDKKSLGVDTGPIPVLWNTDLMDAVKTNQLLRGEWLPVKSSPKQYVYSRLSNIFYCAGSWLCSISDWFDERT